MKIKRIKLIFSAINYAFGCILGHLFEQMWTKHVKSHFQSLKTRFTMSSNVLLTFTVEADPDDTITHVVAISCHQLRL